MSTPPPRRNTTAGMAAGMLLLSGVVLGGLVGGAIGALVGAFGPLLAVGIFLGFVGGTVAVIVRFRDL
ncbi:MAG: hypothetical protein ACJ762_12045 [Solirubrobacteraceae bacterium]